MFQSEGDTARLEADVVIDGYLYKHSGVRYKGFSSWNSGEIKNPFNIRLDYKIKNQNHQGYSKLKLSNVIHDPSFIREVLSYEIVRTYMPAPGSNFARLYINDSLLGLYTNVEAVDKPLINRYFPDDNGVFFKGDPETLIFPFGQNANLALTHGTDSNSYVPYYKLESDYGWSQVLRLIDCLDNKPDSITSLINVDQVLWMHAINYVLVNLDSYIGYAQNYYMYQDLHGRFNPFIWDMNMSFGSFRESDASTNFQGLSIDDAKALDPLQHLSFSISPRPLIKNLLLDEYLKCRYIAHMRTIIEDYFRNGYYYQRAVAIRKIIDADVLADTNRFYSYNDFLLNLDTVVGGTAGMNLYPGIRDLMEARVAYLDTYPGFKGAPQIKPMPYTPVVPVQESKLNVRAKVIGTHTVEVSYRNEKNGLFKTVPMYDDGNHNDVFADDSIFGTAIPVEGTVVQWYYFAKNDSAAIFSPERAETEYYQTQAVLKQGDLVFNEIMLKNTGIQTDQDGEYEPWIELLNTTNECLKLKDICLSDSPYCSLNCWSFPDTSINPHSFIIVWLDGDLDQQGLHTAFTVPASYGHLYLLNTNNETIGCVFYEKQSDVKSYGRYPNGYGPFVYMIPTYSKNNYMSSVPNGKVHLYPNPVNESVYIEGTELNGNVDISVFNTFGQMIITERLDVINDAFLTTLSAEGQAPGVYFVSVDVNDCLFWLKYVKK